nr:unnamed protein product [Spirometra erinaceieuropaei]
MSQFHSLTSAFSRMRNLRVHSEHPIRCIGCHFTSLILVFTSTEVLVDDFLLVCLEYFISSHFMRSYINGFIPELKCILSLAWPLMLTHLLRFINPSLSIMICGHLSREELDAASLANSVINVLGLSIDMGFSTASETLFCQTYGSKKRKLMGLLLQRALLIMTMLFGILACIHINIESILLHIGQSPIISSLTAEYITYFLPGLFFDFMFMTLARYLESQNLVRPMVMAACAGTVFTLFAQFFVLQWNLGLSTFVLMVELLPLEPSAYSFFSIGCDFLEALSDWGIFFRLGVPGILMIALEEWCLELNTFVAGTMSEEVLGAQAIAFQIQSIIYMKCANCQMEPDATSASVPNLIDNCLEGSGKSLVTCWQPLQRTIQELR